MTRPSFPILVAILLVAAFTTGACSREDDDDDSAISGFPPGDDDADRPGEDVSDDDGGDDDAAPGPSLLPGPGEPGYDEGLEALARMYDRSFHVFTTAGTGLNVDLSVPVSHTEDRALIESFLRETDGWDFEAYSGKAVFDVVTAFHKVAGLYAGVGVAADAFRYGVLRDQGYPAEEVERAREHLLAGLEGVHIAHAITGVPGVIARGFTRLDIPGDGPTTPLTPLFDEDGNPLPPEKNNGTWRADNSGGLYPNYIWEDSCSRDQFIGWVTSMAAAWEVIRDDPSFPDEVKARLQEDARLIGMSLSVVRASGYDLEIFDADGRTTYHGYLNENNFDRIYLPFLPFKNGMYALMALGCVGALAYVAEDPELSAYLDYLIDVRGLHRIVWDNQAGIDLGVKSNYSGYNMAFQGAFLATRYIHDGEVTAAVSHALTDHLYDHPSYHIRQPQETKQSLFDFVTAAGIAGATAWSPARGGFDAGMVARGSETLHEFPIPPYWDYEVIHCDEAEIEAGRCELQDGSFVDCLGYVGRNASLVAGQPIPMRLRAPSNYWWRSNPYGLNGGGDGSNMMPGVDFRWAYWMARWVR